MKRVPQGLIRQSDDMGKTWTGITHNAYTEMQLWLSVISGDSMESRIVKVQYEECNEISSN